MTSKNKGKQRSLPPLSASPTERSPLLSPSAALRESRQGVAVSNAGRSGLQAGNTPTCRRYRPGWRSLFQAKTILFLIATLILSLFLLLALLLNSYRPTTFEVENILPNAIIIDQVSSKPTNRSESRSRDGDLIAEGLKSVRVLNMTDAGVWVEVNGTWAVDLNKIFGIGAVYTRTAEAEISRLRKEEAHRACDLALLYGPKHGIAPDHKADTRSHQHCINEHIESSSKIYTFRGQCSPFFESLRSRLAKYAWSLIDPLEVVLPEGVEVWSDVNPFMEGKKRGKEILLGRLRISDGVGGGEGAEGEGIGIVGVFSKSPPLASAPHNVVSPPSSNRIPLISLQIHLSPPPSSTTSTVALLSQLKQYWIDGTAELKIKVPRVAVRTRRAGGLFGWRKWVKREERGLEVPVEVESE